jgi:hypothetical protein
MEKPSKDYEGSVDKYGFFSYERVPLFAFFTIFVICSGLGIYINTVNDDIIAPDTKTSLSVMIGTVAFIAFAILVWLITYRKQKNITLQYPFEFRMIMLAVTVIAVGLAIGLQYIVESDDVAQTLGFIFGILAIIAGSFFIYFQSSGQRVSKTEILKTIKSLDDQEVEEFLVKQMGYKKSSPLFEEIKTEIKNLSPEARLLGVSPSKSATYESLKPTGMDDYAEYLNRYTNKPKGELSSLTATPPEKNPF